MQYRVGADPDVEESTIVVVCPSCAARARAFQQPQIRGVRVTSVVLFGVDGSETWTVMARRGGSLLAVSNASSEEEATFEVLTKLGVLT